MRYYLLLLLCLALPFYDYAQTPHIDYTVATDGSGDFTTLTAAIQALPMYTYERVVIFIKKGVYNEKIRIEQV